MRYSRDLRPQDPGELVDDGSFQCCVRIGRSRLLCGKKSSHFPFTWFVGPDWYCMCVTYILIVVPTVLFIRNVAVFYGAPIIVITVVMCATTLTFFSLIACSDPGIVFEVKDLDGESLQDEEEGGHDIEMMSPASRPYSPVDSADPIDIHNNHNTHQHQHHNREHDELTLVEPNPNPDLSSVNLEEGSNNHSNKHSNSYSHYSPSDQNSVQDITTSPNTNTSPSTNTTHTNTNQNGAVSNRIVVGAAQRASRGVHSSGTNSLAGTPINAPYLPPPRIECGRCQIMRPRDASHCHDCGVCVRKLDHHCPWTGKCIGEKTIKNFYAFLMSLCFLIGFVVVVVIVAFAQQKDIFNFDHPGRE